MAPATAQALVQAKDLGQAPLEEVRLWLSLWWFLWWLWLPLAVSVLALVVLVRVELNDIRKHRKH